MLSFPNYRNVIAYGFGNPFTDRWVPALPFRGSELVESSYQRGVNYWHIQIVPEAEIYIPAAELQAILDIVNPDARDQALQRILEQNVADGVTTLAGTARSYGSMLKVRLKWGDGPSRVRKIDFDLGAGVDVILPPSFHVEGQLLVPAPPVGETTSVPPLLTSTPTGFITSVTCRFDCITPTSNLRQNAVRYTDLRYVEAGRPALITRKRSTHRISAVADSPIGDLELIWDRDPPSPNFPSGLMFGQFPVGSYSASPTGGNQITIHDIPGAANIIVYRTPGDTQYVSIIQELTF